MLSTINNLVEKNSPKWLYKNLVSKWSKDGFKKYFKNTGWMFIARIVSFVTSFFTIIFVARYLGPENLGKLSYAQSLITIFSMFASLGIDHIVYRDLVAHPDREKEILGTAIVTKLFFGTVTFIATVTTAILLNDEVILIWLVAIIALSFIFQPLGVVGHVFNARVLSKYPSLVSIVIALLIPLLKLTIIWTNKGILWFAVLIAIEALIICVFYVLLYKKVLHGSIRTLSFSWATFKQLTHDSWPLMLVGVTGYLYVRIDQVMIQHLIDSTSVGLYEAAVRLTEPLGFLPGIIIGSLFPALINARKDSQVEYQKRFRNLVVLCLAISSTLALILFIFAEQIVYILYGPEYAVSASILQIYVWSTVGTVATLLFYHYFIAENRTHIQLIYTSIGATLNIILNVIFIPIYGITGAAYATLITVIFTVIAYVITWRYTKT